MMQIPEHKTDWMRWAKRLKSDIALTYLLGGCAEDSRLEKIFSRHVELGNVIEHKAGGWMLNPKAPRDGLGGLANFD